MFGRRSKNAIDWATSDLTNQVNDKDREKGSSSLKMREAGLGQEADERNSRVCSEGASKEICLKSFSPQL